MATITNYYEELGLNPEMSIEEIGIKLDQLETVWNQRLFNEPEKANNTLALISEAREKFSTPEVKMQYDKMLLNPLDESMPQDERQISFEKWYSQAVGYFNEQQYDLALTAIEKAIQFYTNKDENDEYLSYAADIYRVNKDYQTALKYINEAIILQPQNDLYLFIKGLIYLDMGSNKEACEYFKKASDTTSNPQSKSRCLTYLAHTLLYKMQDFEAAEIAVTSAIEYGDVMGIGQQILADLQKPQPMDVSNLYDCLYTKYGNEVCSVSDEINRAAEVVLNNMRLLGKKNQVISNKHIELVYPSDDIMHKCTYTIVLEDSGAWCLYGNIHMRTEDTRAYVGDEQTRKEYGRIPDLPDDLLREFDFDGAVSFSDRHNHGLVGELESFDSFPLPYKQTRLSRTATKKGKGLLKRLTEIIAGQETEIKQKAEEAERQRQVQLRRKEEEKKQAEKRAEEEARAMKWKSQGKCQYCGGEFKGLFTKKCVNCGRTKNYS